MEIESISFPEKLTNIFKPAQLQKLLQNEFYRARRYKFPLSCMMLSFTNFFSLRDLYGQEFAKQLLEEGLHIVEKGTRRSDLICRKSIDRFLVILPHTDEKGAFACARRLLKAFEEASFRFSTITVKFIINIGIAESAEEKSVFKETLLDACEESLERAVKIGPNSIFVQDKGVKEQEKKDEGS